MTMLFIDTVANQSIEIIIKDNLKIIGKKKIYAPRAEAEKLLPLIDNIIKENNLDLKDIKRIKVNNRGGSFTGLRIGVITANALGYALGIPVEGKIKNLRRRRIRLKRKKSKIKNIKFNIVKPIYDKEPNITKKKRIVD